MVFKKKLRRRSFPVSFPKILRRPILQNISKRMLKWIKRIVFTKSIHRKAPVKTSFLEQLQTHSFCKIDSITDGFLWKLWSFTEIHFYRTLMCDGFWFPVTFSMHHLLYQQKISSVRASYLGLSEKRSVCPENI